MKKKQTDKTRAVPVWAVYLLSFFCIGLLWQVMAAYVDAPLILPPLQNVFRSLLSLCCTFLFWQNVWATFVRCMLSFVISVLAGTGIGVLCGISPFCASFLELPLAVIRATPVVSFILLALFWFDSSSVPVFVSVLMTLPVMATAVASGFRNRRHEISDMAHMYGFTFLQNVHYVTLPAVLPYFLSGAVSSFGLSWKVVAAGEVLSLPRKGTGTLLETAQVHLETAQVIAVTVVIVLLSFTLEQLFSFAVRRAFAPGKEKSA